MKVQFVGRSMNIAQDSEYVIGKVQANYGIELKVHWIGGVYGYLYKPGKKLSEKKLGIIKNYIAELLS